jgi:cell division septation protein DedD
MNISHYILKLLKLRNSIILPGFGEFQIDNDFYSGLKDGTFSPHAGMVKFNPGTKANDYVLAKYVAEKEGVTISEGNEQIKTYVEQVWKSIRMKQKWIFDGLGSCILDSESNTILFSYDQESNYSAESFGLPAVTLTPVTSEESVPNILSGDAHKVKTPETTELPKKETVSENSYPEPVKIPSSVQKSDSPNPEDINPIDAQQKPVLHHQETILPVERKKKRKYVLLIFLVALFTGLITIGIWKQETVIKGYHHISQNIQRLLEDDPRNKPHSSVEDTIKQGEGKKPDQPIPVSADTSPQDDSLSTNLKPMPAQTEYSKPFVIMAAAFSNKNNAERMVENLIKEGFTDATIDGQTASGLWRVAAGFYTSEAEAQNVIREAQTKNQLQNAFVAPRE